MKIFYIGTVEFSYVALKRLTSLNADIVGVATKRDSAFNADFADLGPLCEENELEFRYIQDINDGDTVEWIKALEPDILFCFGWSSLLKEEVLNSAPMGVIGFHPAELPQNRGRHPVIWALVLGLHKTGSTFFFMDQGADSGDILSQRQVLIGYSDDARSLYNKITQTALDQIQDFLPRLQKGTYPRLPQDHSLANTWRKRGKLDGKIDFRLNSRTVYNLVRALTLPYVGAHLEYEGSEIKIWRVSEELICMPNIEPGRILNVRDGAALVKCADKAVWLLDHDFESMPVIGQYFV